MPSLTWASKTLPILTPAALEVDSIVYPQGAGYSWPLVSALPANRLILGDNLPVMSALLPEYEGRIQLIYADPPFFTNRHYPARIGRGEDSRRPGEWQLAEGYADHWASLDAYLDFLYHRLVLMYLLLAPGGTLYLHLDWHANAYARLLLDEIFGAERLLNEIVWVYHGPSPIRSAFNRKHDTILAYTKSADYLFNADAVRTPYDESTVKTFASSPKAGFGKVPDLARGKVPEDWWYFPVVARLHNERSGYPTQKPEALLERIILASSNPGDLVADFFCGSGTTAVVAARLGRQFLACDATFRAVHTTRTRLVQTAVASFAVQSSQAADRRPMTVERPTLRQAQGRQLNVQRSQRGICLPPDILPTIDYWEADPAFEGRIFYSAAQGVRPRRGQLIDGELILPEISSDHPLYIRWVTVEGEQLSVISDQ